MFLYFFYYFTQSFVSEPLRKAYLAFMIIYVLVSTLPQLLAALAFLDRSVNEQPFCKKVFNLLLRFFLALIFGQYLCAIFFYHFETLTRSNRDGLRISTSISRFAQMFVQVTMMTILGMNVIDNPVKGLTIGLSAFQFVFNIIVAFCILSSWVVFYSSYHHI